MVVYMLGSTPLLCHYHKEAHTLLQISANVRRLGGFFQIFPATWSLFSKHRRHDHKVSVHVCQPDCCGNTNLPKELPMQGSKITAVPLSSLKNIFFFRKKTEKEVHIDTGFGVRYPLFKTSLNWKLPWKSPSTQQGRRAHFSSQLFVG